MKHPIRLHTLLKSHSPNPDIARREFILNVLLFGIFIVSSIAFLASVINLLAGRFVNGRGSVVVVGVFVLMIALLWYIARKGHQTAANYGLLGLVGLLVVWLMIEWSFELAISELCYGFLIVLSGVLLSARSALRFSIMTLIVFLIGSYGQIAGWMHPTTNWLNQPVHYGDAIGDAIIFSIIIIISWLANREIDRSLLRARSSEVALAHERDTLEVKVFERTRQLEENQATRLLELQRFVEFGRLSANLLHEVSNPLTAASLNLEQLEAENHSQLSFQLRENVQRIEKYVTAARKQLIGQGEIAKFNVSAEINTVVRSIEQAATKLQVEIVVKCNKHEIITGDAVKFSQLIRNLLSNAVEAYVKVKSSVKIRHVELVVKRQQNSISIEVHDWGIGIKNSLQAKIFDPFYSTKQSTNHNLGIGLSMVKQFVEDDFGGSISVSSSEQEGTIFLITLRRDTHQR